MSTTSVESRTRARSAWGVGLFSTAAITLLGWVWSGLPLGTLAGVMVLTGLAVGGGLVVWGIREEVQLPPQPVTQPTPSPVACNEVPPHLEKVLAEIALLAWKIDKRAQKEPNPPKPILRNAARIIEMLGEHKVELVSYEGRKIDMGSRVEVQEAVADEEEDKVLAEHEPEIQVNGKLTRKALVTVGRGKKPTANPSSKTEQAPTE